MDSSDGFSSNSTLSCSDSLCGSEAYSEDIDEETDIETDLGNHINTSLWKVMEMNLLSIVCVGLDPAETTDVTPSLYVLEQPAAMQRLTILIVQTFEYNV